jgi:hypothetical protein
MSRNELQKPAPPSSNRNELQVLPAPPGIRNELQIAAAPARTCTVCAAEFPGRADAVYCSSACRQKSYRARYKAEVGERRDPADVGDALRQMEDVNFLTMYAKDMLTAERLNNYLPEVKLFMAGALRRMLHDVEESCARDLANGSITAAEKRKTERKIASKYGPVRPRA